MVRTKINSKENIIDVKIAVLMIAVFTGLILAGGLYIGRAYFWDQYVPMTKVDRDLQVALNNVKADPENAVNHIALGWVYFQRGELAKALKAYGRAEEIDPDNMQLKFNLAMAKLQMGDFGEARRLMENYVAKNPLHGDGFYLLGLIYKEQKQYKKAVEQLEKSIEVSPGNTNVYFNMGEIYEFLGDVDAAVRYYQKTLDYNPQYKAAAEALIRLTNN